MTDQSIFNNDDEGSQAPEASGKNEQVPAVDQLLGSIVNAEGKQKYASIEEALKGLNAAQEHISRLENENNQFKQKVEKSTTLQDVLDAMKPQKEGEPAKATPSLDEDKLAELLERVVERKETVSTQKTNAATVAAKFRELHGEHAETKYYEAAASIGMSKVEINTLAAKNPTAVFAMLGINSKQAPVKGMQSSANPATFSQKTNDMPKFDPMRPAPNSTLEKWKKSTGVTSERLGLDN